MSTDLWETLKSIGNTMEAKRLHREKEAADRQAAEAARAAASAPRPVARYLTAGGAAVEVTERAGFYNYDGMTETHANCTGCPAAKTFDWGFDPLAVEVGLPQKDLDEDGKLATPQARDWAQAHAEQCRAMPLQREA